MIIIYLSMSFQFLNKNNNIIAFSISVMIIQKDFPEYYLYLKNYGEIKTNNGKKKYKI